ncbi:MAG: T9SS type A sorting domain-containing protein [Bacteroidetes bacterium]|nr:T9SS type A sorting domain-containing protein [Bacteroidota bacterium]MCW5896000.1 T9SS type A sorting domain-containing protein [Bacteroidota bacterium]
MKLRLIFAASCVAGLVVFHAAAQTNVYTTLWGFYDYQTNSTCQFVRVNPVNGKIHVVYMTAYDSTNIASSRRTAYALGINNGTQWNNFNNVNVPSRQSGFPSLDLLKGPNAGLPVIVNHTSSGIGTTSSIYVDSPEGSGAFSELNQPPTIGDPGLPQPIWPDVAGLSDGSIAVAASTNATPCTLVVSVTSDFTSFSPWQGPSEYNCSGKYVIEGSDSGRVGLLYTSNSGLRLYESTVGSLTWHDTLLVPLPIVIGPDTFALWGSIDFVYYNNQPLVVMALQQTNRPPTHDGAVIGFWSRATGPKIAIPRGAVTGLVDTLNRPQSRHLSMGYPVIGMSGEYPVVGFQAFKSNISATGFNYSDVFWTFSIDNGMTWVPPMNLTFTTSLDERYPSVSRWNHAGAAMAAANLVWQEDPEPGSHIMDGAPLSRSKQVFRQAVMFWNSAGEQGRPLEFALHQNYPNPFNPGTAISYQLSAGGHVTLKVYDLLGREVAALVDEVKNAGEHSVQFNASGFSSGVYYYRLQAGNYIATKKMLLIR